MQKALFLLIAVYLFSVPAYSQFTLTQANFATAPSGEDSVSTSYGTTGIPLNITGAGSNLSLDFSNINYFYTDTPFVLHLPYAGYTYQEFAAHYIKMPQLYYDARSLFNIGTMGIIKAGERIDGRGYTLAGAPGANLTDSIIFPQQTNLYSSAYNKLVFPATYNSSWSSSLHTSTTFVITYSNVYNHTSCTYKSYITEKDSVIGYGKVIVKTASNKMSDFIPVIEVRVRYHQADSFFSGTNTLFDQNTLTSFNLAQGQTTDAYDYKFYRSGETTPLVDVFFADSTYSYQGITHTYAHTQRVANVGVQQYNADGGVSIYPNPVTSRAFTIQIPDTYTGKLSYRILNIEGREMAASNMAHPGKVPVQLPATAIPGTYYMQVYNNGKQVCVRSVTVQ
jgi:hypothetical protein